MDEKLVIFLEKMNVFFTDEEKQMYFNNAELVEITSSISKKEIRAFIKLSDFLPINILQKLEMDLTSETQPIKIKLNLIIENKNYNHQLIWQHIEYVKNNKAQNKSSTIAFLSRDNVLYDSDKKLISFVVSTETEKNLLINEQEYYKEKLKKYGFQNINIEIIISEDKKEDLLKTVEEQLYKQVQQEALIQNKSQSTAQPLWSKPTFKNKIDLLKPDYESILDLEEDAVNVTVHGKIIEKNIRRSKSQRNIYNLIITDGTSSIKCIYFQRGTEISLFDEINSENKSFFLENIDQKISENDWIAINGSFTYSNFDKDHVFYISKFQKIKPKNKTRKDDELNKRVELHTHTKMSVMDGVSDVSEYINTAKKWGWKAIALTDHLNVQSFPDAYAAISKVNKNVKDDEKLKLIYGSEIVILNDDYWFVKNPKGNKLKSSKFVVFDLETTGLSPEYDEIIEFGAHIFDYEKQLSEKIDILIKPTKPISSFTTELTNITNDMLEDKKSIEEEFKNIYDLISDGILIAHNASFDINFLNITSKKLGYGELTNTVIDTLAISRAVFPKLKNHRLGTVAKYLGIYYDEKNAHRADYDTEVLTNVYERLWNRARETQKIDIDSDWEKFRSEDKLNDQNFKRMRGYHLQVLVKNQTGIKDLYKLISYSHTKNFITSPKIFKNNLLKLNKNKNLLIGSGCLNGEVFEHIRSGTFEMLTETIKKLDYVEIQPLSVYKKLVHTQELSQEQVQCYIKKIIEVAKQENVMIVATSDAHYVDPESKLIRDIYIDTKGLGGVYHPLYDFKKRVKDNPDQHLRTTKEMLEEFAWLEDEQLIYEIVIKNPNLIADLVEHDIKPVKEGLYPPKIDNADILLREECYKNAKEMYGEELPEIVVLRLEKELKSITKHDFAVIYWISHLLVKKSHEDGYLVGSRGSIGSSFVATTARITEVNPLKTHYRCVECKFSDFNTPLDVKCGFDLPEKNCPQCGKLLIGDGHDIPFETFLGFDGDKIPDIDLNFSGEYQAIAHNLIKDMFGEYNVFRAGTISTVADKTAFSFARNYFENNNIENIRKAELSRLANTATGVKRTAGQHPGGIIIIPKGYEVEDFTPVNYPADDNSSSWLTTHFDFHSIHDNLLKMDILGHLDPTALRMLQDLTGVNPKKIPVNDKKVYALFSNLDSLNLKPEQILGETTGAVGLPEFGTPFVRNMLKEIKPKTFADLVQVSGLSHGTDVYVGNAQNLIKENIATISSVIGCRDDIMVYLMKNNIDPSTSFNIMESVRKGNGLTKEWIEIMRQHNIPDWYINSCFKIKYMFPKAHATAYVLMAYRVAWFKIYYPAEYYATWFSTRADFFDLETVIGGINKVRTAYEITQNKINKNELVSNKEKSLQPIYEVLIEMFERGITIENININISDSEKFIVKEEEGRKILYPPFSVIDSLGEVVSNSIVNARSIKKITSIKDLTARTQVTKTQVEIFKKLKVFSNLKDDEQLAFDF